MLWLCWQCAACVPIARGVNNVGEGRPIGSRVSAHRDHAKCEGSVAVQRQRSIVAYAFHYQQSNAVLAHVAKGHGCRCLHRIVSIQYATLTWG
jgi:hypothetical protein